MRVLIAAGGTAGHINPALAIAGAIKKADPSAEIHFAGRKEGMEYRLVTQAGYPFHHIEITGFQRKLSLNNIRRNIITLWNLALSGPTAKKMMKEIQPDLVIGCGGYVSGPVVRCAAKQGIKTALHEQNAFPGVTNKLLAPDVDIVFAAVPAAVEKLGAPEKTIVVGNPVRPEVFAQAKNRDAIRAELGAGDRTIILSFGGSLGARRVNEVVADLCAWEKETHRNVLHLHATGSRGVKLFEDLEAKNHFAPGANLVVKEYIDKNVLKENDMINVFSVLDMKASFRRFVSKYYMIGSFLVVILAFIGIMNFFNTTATSVISRKKELALLEVVGMTKKQISKMLVAEGFLYLGGAFVIAVLLVVVGAKQILINTFGTAFFFRLHLTIVPCVLMIPILVGIAYVIPKYQFEKMSRESIVERIRKE